MPKREQNKNELLMDAVSLCNVKEVLYYLKNGSDPNYARFKGDEEPNGYIQPTTPLRMVLFRISDSLLEENDYKNLKEITLLLLEHGADPTPAMQIAEFRYGKYTPSSVEGPLKIIWDIIANAEYKPTI